jgi:hypothetical protein
MRPQSSERFIGVRQRRPTLMNSVTGKTLAHRHESFRARRGAPGQRPRSRLLPAKFDRPTSSAAATHCLKIGEIRRHIRDAGLASRIAQRLHLGVAHHATTSNHRRPRYQ